MENIFLEKSYTKCVGESSPRPFSKKLILSKFLDQYSKVWYSLFLLNLKLRAMEIYWNYAADHLLLPHIIHVKKTCLTFWIILEEKFFSCYRLLMDQISLPGCFYF